ncbi:YesL family protein [Bacillus sp. SCS-153A]|uniref:YesL family protein n=1 Tax=Rossellomorea sedimentorum TaxID=3115294 RepID=UPI0039059887
MKRAGISSGLYRVSEWIMRFSVVNILWILFNLPLVLLLVSAGYAGSQPEQILLWILAAGLVPFVFFPSTAALFASVRDWIIKDEDVGLVKRYWKYYRENYRSSLAGGLILTVLWSIWGSNFFYYKDENTVLFFSFCVFGVLLYVISINFFSLMSHYHLKVRQLIQKAFMITIGMPLLSLVTFLISAMMIYGSIAGPLFMTLFFSGTLLAFLSFSTFYRLYINRRKSTINSEMQVPDNPEKLQGINQ